MRAVSLIVLAFTALVRADAGMDLFGGLLSEAVWEEPEYMVCNRQLIAQSNDTGVRALGLVLVNTPWKHSL